MRNPFTHVDAETVAREFYSEYFQLAPFHGYEGLKPTWEDLPKNEQELIVETFSNLIRANVIRKVQPRTPTTMPQQVPYPAVEPVDTGGLL